MNVEKSNRWAFTAWRRPNVNINLCAYLVWQTEVCPTTKLTHYQGYIETKKDYSFGQIKQIFRDKTMHVEPAREDRVTNLYYCLKKRTQQLSTCYESFHYNGSVVVDLNDYNGAFDESN